MSAEKEITELLSGSTPEVRSLVGTLRKIVAEAVPAATETVKRGWRTITYEDEGIVCYIAPLRKHVDLGFYEGVRLRDPEKLLEGRGKKLRHIKIWKENDIRKREFEELVKEAFEIRRA
ncbi:MAG: DUF1801 domain-containing protein [Candidatus Krumholzibacteriia bacterium]